MLAIGVRYPILVRSAKFPCSLPFGYCHRIWSIHAFQTLKYIYSWVHPDVN